MDVIAERDKSPSLPHDEPLFKRLITERAGQIQTREFLLHQEYLRTILSSSGMCTSISELSDPFQSYCALSGIQYFQSSRFSHEDSTDRTDSEFETFANFFLLSLSLDEERLLGTTSLESCERCLRHYLGKAFILHLFPRCYFWGKDLSRRYQSDFDSLLERLFGRALSDLVLELFPDVWKTLSDEGSSDGKRFECMPLLEFFRAEERVQLRLDISPALKRNVLQKLRSGIQSSPFESYTTYIEEMINKLDAATRRGEEAFHQNRWLRRLPPEDQKLFSQTYSQFDETPLRQRALSSIRSALAPALGFEFGGLFVYQNGKDDGESFQPTLRFGDISERQAREFAVRSEPDLLLALNQRAANRLEGIGIRKDLCAFFSSSFDSHVLPGVFYVELSKWSTDSSADFVNRFLALRQLLEDCLLD